MSSVTTRINGLSLRQLKLSPCTPAGSGLLFVVVPVLWILDFEFFIQSNAVDFEVVMIQVLSYSILWYPKVLSHGNLNPVTQLNLLFIIQLHSRSIFKSKNISSPHPWYRLRHVKSQMWGMIWKWERGNVCPACGPARKLVSCKKLFACMVVKVRRYVLLFRRDPGAW